MNIMSSSSIIFEHMHETVFKDAGYGIKAYGSNRCSQYGTGNLNCNGNFRQINFV